jgi:hypothetical protein
VVVFRAGGNFAVLKFVLLVVSVLPIYADDFAFCSATATDTSGNVQPWNCPDNWQRGLRSFIKAGGNTVSVDLTNYIWPSFSAPPGLTIDYNGESKTSAIGEFVISGGSGTGNLMGIIVDDYAAFAIGIASYSEVYSSNFVYPLPGLGMGQMVTFPFTFGVPFTLTLADDIRFGGGAHNGGESTMEKVTVLSGSLTIFDANGNPVPGATISEVPEVSSAWLLLTMAAGLGLSRALSLPFVK